MIQIIVIIMLTLINAFFASAEMAMVSINRNRLTILAQEGDKRAELLHKLLDEPSKLLATIQVGITMAGFFSSAFAATGLSVGLSQLMSEVGLPYSDQLAIVLITILLAFVMLLFGELFPKRLALQKPEAIALASVRPIYYISRVTKPFVKLLSASTNTLIRLFGLDHEGLEQRVSEEEIRSMVKVGQEFGVINQTEKRMINNIFEFDDKLAREVMTPRMDVMMVDIGVDQAIYLERLIQLKYSRVPVYKNDKDKPLGIIHMKELLVAGKKKGFDHLDIEKLIREPYFVPETMAIDQLFIKLQKDQKHMALLIDEYGMMTGIVTMEDLIEEVMGNIEDEFDVLSFEVELMSEGGYKIDGGLPIFDFNDRFHTDLASEKADTIGGYLISLNGELPSDLLATKKVADGFIFEVIEVTDERIKTIMVKKKVSENTK